MLTRTGLRTTVCAAVALLGVAAAAPALNIAMAAPKAHDARSVEFVNAPADATHGRNVARAVEHFIEGMAKSDLDAVWMFASEEDQDAFGTERAVYEAYAETFPAFTKAATVTFSRFWQEGDTPFVEVAMTDSKGAIYRATMGLWLDDAGDWKLISCDVKPLSDRVASR